MATFAKFLVYSPHAANTHGSHQFQDNTIVQRFKFQRRKAMISWCGGEEGGHLEAMCKCEVKRIIVSSQDSEEGKEGKR